MTASSSFPYVTNSAAYLLQQKKGCIRASKTLRAPRFRMYVSIVSLGVSTGKL